MTSPLEYVKLNIRTEVGVNFFVWSFEPMATKSTRMKVTFECTECKNRNYDSFKNKRNDPDRLELKKYCPVCKKHTVHKESK